MGLYISSVVLIKSKKALYLVRVKNLLRPHFLTLLHIDWFTQVVRNSFQSTHYEALRKLFAFKSIENLYILTLEVQGDYNHNVGRGL